MLFRQNLYDMETIKIKCLILTVAIMFPYVSSNAQSLPDTELKENFAAQVKSIDEFICRFNGSESHPSISDTVDNRMLNLIALFDYDIDHSGLSDEDFKDSLQYFVNRIVESNTMLSIKDSLLYAESSTIVLYKGNKKSIKLYLQCEEFYDNQLRWAIVGAKGLAEAGIIETESYRQISPVEHELHFMSLDETLNLNSDSVMGYRGKDVKIDELSVLFALLMEEELKIDIVEKLTIYCFEVPDFMFTINENVKRNQNSGWLISSITKINEKEKINYISKLLGL